MERHTIAEMKEILEAIEQGKEVQYQEAGTTNEWGKYIGKTPNFFSFRYRVKPEKKWRPFKNTEELILVSTSPNYSVYVKPKGSQDTLLISGYNHNEVYITTYGWKDVGSLLEHFTFVDDTPCGVEEGQ